MRGLLLVVLASLALGGCTTTGGESRYASKPKEAYVLDLAYMQRANHAAKMRGVDLTWVNPPYVNQSKRQR